MNAQAQQTLDLTALPVREPDLAPAALPPAAKPKLSWRAERRRRRKMRHRFEEIVAWIVVPLIVLGLYWGATATMQFLGTSPGQIYEQLMQVKQALQKRG